MPEVAAQRSLETSAPRPHPMSLNQPWRDRLRFFLSRSSDSLPEAESLSSSPRVSFQLARSFLNDHRIVDLAQARDDALDGAVQSGRLYRENVLRSRGSVVGMKMPQRDLNELLRFKEASPSLSWIASFEPEEWIETGHWERISHHLCPLVSDPVKLETFLAQYSKIDPTTRKPFPHRRFTQPSQLILEPNLLDLKNPFVGRPIQEYWTRMAAGQTYLDPLAWARRFYQSLELGLRYLNPYQNPRRLSTPYPELLRRALSHPGIDQYLLNVRTCTLFPQYVDRKTGHLLVGHFNADSREPEFFGIDPVNSHCDDLGARPTFNLSL